MTQMTTLRMQSRYAFRACRSVEIFCHPFHEEAQLMASQTQGQEAGIEAFFGNNHDIQTGDGRLGAHPEAFAQDSLDTVANHGIADFFADGHAEPPGGVPVLARQDEQKEAFAMVAAARFKADRILPLRPNPERRRKA
jgi:hypothetical protein